MRNKLNKILLLLLVAFVGFATWYLFLKKWDYRIYFTTKSSPGIVYQNVHDWNIWNKKLLHENFKITGKEPGKAVDTQVILKDTTLEFNWRFKPINDSLTKVVVGISDPNRKFRNRLLIPFVETAFKKSVLANVSDVKEKIKVLNRSFAFEFIGECSRPETLCVYVSTKSTHRGKAREMMNNVITLNQFVKENELGLNGNPFLLIKNFDFSNDTIHFDFCFPILHAEKVPDHPDIKIKKVKMDKAIKANFYGNYSISDMSWFLIEEQAKRLGKQTNGQILEEYFNDPHSGGNELEWKAEVFMSVK